MKRVRRTNNQIFLDKLKELSKGSSSGAVSNKSLSAELSGWPPERYTSIKDQLVRDKLIKLRKGHGGGVSLVGTSSKPLNVFIAYSHADKALSLFVRWV
jgi:DNA-binding IscR family transcriptional regulator